MQQLPALRKELSFLPAPQGEDGRPRWFLFDPVRNSFHVLTRRAVEILSHWKAETPEASLNRFSEEKPELNVNRETLKDITKFLYQQNLAETSPNGNIEFLAAQESAAKQPLREQLMHKSLFFRVPLFSPQKFLSATAPYIGFLFKKRSWLIILTIGLIGLFFAARQWEQFFATFLYFFTLEGFIFYSLSLTFIKILHELGHAYMAHHFGAHVPIMGIAFLLMFPVLYTDTTDAWRIKSRRDRALIDAGGMIVEFGIACIAIFLWSFLPDGPARSTAFFAATSSWLLSLMVNLNPCMRFDGYYLLSDLCGFQNMQSSGFKLGRWKMRELLWGLKQPKPIHTTPRKHLGLLTYAYATWAYRVFLFFAIGLIVYHVLPKPFGAFIFVAILGVFLGSPLKRELSFWWQEGRVIRSTWRGRFTLILTGLAVLLFFLPWQTRISAPAIVKPAQQTELFPLSAALIEQIHVAQGDVVSKGDLLISLKSEALIFERHQSRKRRKLLTERLNRHAADHKERQSTHTLLQEQAAEEMTLQALETDISRLNIYAPHAGLVSDLSPSLHAGRYVRKTDRLIRIVSPRSQNLIALPYEIEAERIYPNARFTFISDDAAAKPIKGQLTSIAPVSEATITDIILTSESGGRIAVNKNEKGQLIAHVPVLKVHGRADDEVYLSRAQRGIVTLKVKRQSPAYALWRSVIRVLIRETDI